MRRSWLPTVRWIFESGLYGKNADQISYSDSQQLLSLDFILVHKCQMDPYSKWAYGLNRSGFESQQKQFIFFLLLNVHTGSGAHPASNQWAFSKGTKRSFLGVKRSGRKTDHWPLSSAEVKYEWNYTCTAPTCPHGVYSDNSVFYVCKIYSNFNYSFNQSYCKQQNGNYTKMAYFIKCS
jgi:hypothetical protein